jgi:hypothetical protein
MVREALALKQRMQPTYVEYKGRYGNVREALALTQRMQLQKKRRIESTSLWFVRHLR